MPNRRWRSFMPITLAQRNALLASDGERVEASGHKLAFHLWETPDRVVARLYARLEIHGRGRAAGWIDATNPDDLLLTCDQGNEQEQALLKHALGIFFSIQEQ